MREKIIELAKKCDADIVGFAPSSRFDKDDPVFKIFPNTKTVIGLGFRILRGIFRGVEEGTTYYQYTTMGVENLEETVMPMALIRVANAIEEEGFIDNETSELIQSAIEFKDTTAHEIMTPRVDIFDFDLEDDVNELIHNEEIFSYSRIIVYEETIDNIKGFISTRKLLTLLLESNPLIDLVL